MDVQTSYGEVREGGGSGMVSLDNLGIKKGRTGLREHKVKQRREKVFQPKLLLGNALQAKALKRCVTFLKIYTSKLNPNSSATSLALPPPTPSPQPSQTAPSPFHLAPTSQTGKSLRPVVSASTKVSGHSAEELTSRKQMLAQICQGVKLRPVEPANSKDDKATVDPMDEIDYHTSKLNPNSSATSLALPPPTPSPQPSQTAPPPFHLAPTSQTGKSLRPVASASTKVSGHSAEELTIRQQMLAQICQGVKLRPVEPANSKDDKATVDPMDEIDCHTSKLNPNSSATSLALPPPTPSPQPSQIAPPPFHLAPTSQTGKSLRPVASASTKVSGHSAEELTIRKQMLAQICQGVKLRPVEPANSKDDKATVDPMDEIDCHTSKLNPNSSATSLAIPPPTPSPQPSQTAPPPFHLAPTSQTAPPPFHLAPTSQAVPPPPPKSIALPTTPQLETNLLSQIQQGRRILKPVTTTDFNLPDLMAQIKQGKSLRPVASASTKVSGHSAEELRIRKQMLALIGQGVKLRPVEPANSKDDKATVDPMDKIDCLKQALSVRLEAMGQFSSEESEDGGDEWEEDEEEQINF